MGGGVPCISLTLACVGFEQALVLTCFLLVVLALLSASLGWRCFALLGPGFRSLSLLLASFIWRWSALCRLACGRALYMCNHIHRVAFFSNNGLLSL